MRSLSIVIPAYNEEATIREVVRDALAVGAEVAERLEVVVLDDASTDGTGAILDELAAGDARVRVLRRAKNAGIEASMRALYADATGDFVFLSSADGQWPMAALRSLAEEVARGADLVVGTRPNRHEVYSFYRRIVSRGYEAIARALGAPVGDPGSIKLGRADLLRVPVVSRGVFAEAERVIRAVRAGARVRARDVPFGRRRASAGTGARPLLVARALLDALRVAWSLRACGRFRPGRG